MILERLRFEVETEGMTAGSYARVQDIGDIFECLEFRRPGSWAEETFQEIETLFPSEYEIGWDIDWERYWLLPKSGRFSDQQIVLLRMHFPDVWEAEPFKPFAGKRWPPRLRKRYRPNQ